jgi:hypothetical protein
MLTVIHITPYAEASDKQFAQYQFFCKVNGKTESNPKSLKEFLREVRNEIKDVRDKG